MINRFVFSVIFIVSVFFEVGFDNDLFAQIATLEPTLSLKIVNGMYVPFQNDMPVPAFDKQPRNVINLAGVWKKQRFIANHDLTLSQRDSIHFAALLMEAGDRYKPSFNDDSWEDKILPAVENQMNAYEKAPEYYEDGVWYRKKFSVSDSLAGKFTKLVFYAVNYVADVWLNGHYLGYHEGGYTPFAFNVSSVVCTDTVNVLAVRVDNPPWGTRQDIIPYIVVDWFNYTGIIHDVYLEFSDPVSTIRADIVPLNIDGDISVKTVIGNISNVARNIEVLIGICQADVNQGNIQTDIAADLTGSAASFSGNSQTTLTIPVDSLVVWQSNLTISDPNLWSPKEPNLYILKVELEESGETIDEFYTEFGIRTIETSGDKLLINGAPVFYTGLARHEDHPDYGRSIPLTQIYLDLQVAGSLNANFLRTAHYPNHPYTYLITDRLGFATMEEIPLWWFDVESAWIIHNQRKIHQQMWREMIFRDYNRPSVFLWGTCNECLNVPYRQAFIDSVSEDLNARYPDGRMVTQSAAADRPGANDPSQAVCDVAGWTMYFGVFYGSEFYQGTHDFLEDAHFQYPSKPILDTEFGFWSSENGSNELGQKNCFIQTFNAFEEKAVVNGSGLLNPAGFVMAATWWCVFDWYSAGHPNGFQSMGIYHMDRATPKQITSVLRNKYLPYFYHGGTVGLENNIKNSQIPKQYLLMQNYPNPFNPVTEIRFQLPESTIVKIMLFNLRGQLIRKLINEERSAGEHQIFLNAHGLPSGIYFYEMNTENFRQSRKMVLIR
jgi:beta-galactosidase